MYQAIAVVRSHTIVTQLLPQFTLVQFKLGDVGEDTIVVRENYALLVNGDGEAVVVCEAFSKECLLDTVENALTCYSQNILGESFEVSSKNANEECAKRLIEDERQITEFVSWS
jgi:hypothetical protein